MIGEIFNISALEIYKFVNVKNSKLPENIIRQKSCYLGEKILENPFLFKKTHF
jgi:hypothetical protein